MFGFGVSVAPQLVVWVRLEKKREYLGVDTYVPLLTILFESKESKRVWSEHTQTVQSVIKKQNVD